MYSASDWLGVYINDDYEVLEINEANEDYVVIEYTALTPERDRYKQIHLELGYIDDEKTIAAEDISVLEAQGWYYTFCLENEYIEMEGYYPPIYFYRQ